jgi:hypothetical protein
MLRFTGNIQLAFETPSRDQHSESVRTGYLFDISATYTDIVTG